MYHYVQRRMLCNIIVYNYKLSGVLQGNVNKDAIGDNLLNCHSDKGLLKKFICYAYITEK